MNRSAILLLRGVLVAACGVWGFYLLAMLRTSGFGMEPRDFWGLSFGALICVGPLALIPFIGLRKKKVLVGVLAICGGSLLAAEAFGRTQELLVVSEYGEFPSDEIQLSRWWPFEHHAMFGSKYGWDGSD